MELRKSCRCIHIIPEYHPEYSIRDSFWIKTQVSPTFLSGKSVVVFIERGKRYPDFLELKHAIHLRVPSKYWGMIGGVVPIDISRAAWFWERKNALKQKAYKNGYILEWFGTRLEHSVYKIARKSIYDKIIDWRNRKMAHQIARVVKKLENHDFLVFTGARHVPGLVSYLVEELSKCGFSVSVKPHSRWGPNIPAVDLPTPEVLITIAPPPPSSGLERYERYLGHHKCRLS